MKAIRFLTSLALVAILAGCAASQKLTDADRAKFKSASVSPQVEKGEVFLLAPGAQNIGFMFGAIGALAVQETHEEKQRAFAGFLERNGISVEKIVREEVEKVLRDSGKLAIVAPGQPDAATIKIAVPQYGFGVTTLLSSKVVPVIQIKLEMVDGSGRMLWTESERILPSVASPMESTTWKEMADNPAKVEDELRKAAAYVAKKLVAEL